MARGDHIYVHRYGGTVSHHGIDCGDGTVIHYKEGETITRSTCAFFSKGEEISIQHYDDCDPPAEVIKRAESRLGERDYHVIFNNCEHFAVWCKTGQHRSNQVDNLLSASLAGGVLGGLAMGGAFAIPAIAAVGAYSIHQKIAQAYESKDPQQSINALASAYSELQTAYRELEQRRDRACKEAYAWDCAARLALQRNREDLARAALKRKLPHKKAALQHDRHLNQLAPLLQDLEAKQRTIQQACLNQH